MKSLSNSSGLELFMKDSNELPGPALDVITSWAMEVNAGMSGRDLGALKKNSH